MVHPADVAEQARRLAQTAVDRQFGSDQRPRPVLQPFDLAEPVETVGDVQACLRSEEHTSELQSLMRSSYAVFCLKKKIHKCYKQARCIKIDISHKHHTTD